MCGICGFLKTKQSNRDYASRHIRVMNDAMAHRGPDGEGVYIARDGICGLGHRRLSIIDLSDAASQPMGNADGSVQMAFNGEIYNHREIRAELLSLGVTCWMTDHSDTEVILRAYEKWGMECLDRFRGMFAIAIWDEKKRKIYLVRDRMGIKPLYYTFDGDTLIFASEIKAILAVLPRKPQINEKALYDYLSFLCTPCRETMFEGIYKVRPSEWMSVDADRNVSVTKYYELLDHTREDLRLASEKEIENELMKELGTSVELRKESDVPVGVFLSGGVDSSINASMFSKNEGSGVKAFCIGYQWKGENCEQNENEYAREVADYCGAEYYEKFITGEEWLELVPEIVRMQDEPIADPTCASSYYVAKLARDNGIIVSQVGEGADELFCGYPAWLKYIKAAELGRAPFPKQIKKIIMGFMQSRDFGDIRSEAIRRNLSGQPVFWSGAEAFFEPQKRKLISGDFSRRLGGYTSFEAIRPTYENFTEKAARKTDLDWMAYADLCHRLPELLLMRVDKMSMWVSLECRVPFLDHKFVELAMGIPSDLKIKNKTTKYILKKAARGIVPNSVIDRRKTGFAAPVYEKFMANLADSMKNEVMHFTGETGLLSREYLDEMFQSESFSGRIWYLYNLAVWYRTYFN